MKAPIWGPRIAGIVDQGLSSASNLALSILVAREASLGEFADFSAAIVAYLASVLISRGFIGEVAVLLGSSDLRAEVGRRSGRVFWASMTVAACLAIALSGVSLIVGGASMLVIAAALSILIFQDSCRFISFGLGEPGVALLNDALWLALFAASAGALIGTGTAEPLNLLVAWCLCAIPGTIAAGMRLGLFGFGQGSLGWLRTHWERARPLALDATLSSFNQFGVLLLVGSLGQNAAVAAIRGSQVILGPLNTVSAGLALAVTPRAVQRFKASQSTTRLGLYQTFSALAAITVCWAIGWAFIPDDIGQRVLGESWETVASVIALVGVSLALNFLGFPAVTTLKVVGRQQTVARLRVFLVLLSPPAILVGAVTGGAQGAAWGMVASSSLNATVFNIARKRATLNLVETPRHLAT